MPHRKMLERIHLAYLDASGAIAEKFESASNLTKWEEASRFTDYAFYILLFAQLERYVFALYSEREGNIASAADQPSFLHCVNVVFSKWSPKAQQIGEYYKLRCDLAHGKMTDGKAVEVSAYAQHFQKIMTEPVDPDADKMYRNFFND